jgi:sugar phosphate permease
MALTRTGARPLIFYGWYIVAAALVAQFVAVGTQMFAIGVFLTPMTEELGWTRGDFSGVQTVSTFVGGGIGFVIGGVIDRRGPRLLMLTGAIVAGGMLLATAQVESLWQFYIIRGVGQSLSMALVGNIVVNVTIARWFVARRGLAVAIASAGISLGGVVMAPLTSFWVIEFGWRSAWVMLGVLVWALLIPAAMVMRRAPEDYGLKPDNMDDATAAQVAAGGGRSAAQEEQWTREEARRTRAMWLITFAYGASTIGLVALLLHGIPLLMDSGFSLGRAALLFSAFAWAALLAKAIWGGLMDRYHARYLSAIGFLVAAAGTIGLMGAVHTGSTTLVLLALVIYGIAVGGTAPLQETVWADYFGRLHLGSIRALAMPLTILFSAGGPLLAGGLYDRTGSYDISFVVFAGFSLLAFVLIMAARPPRHSGGASAARLSAGLVARAAPQRSLLRPPDDRGAVVG